MIFCALSDIATCFIFRDRYVILYAVEV